MENPIDWQTIVSVGSVVSAGVTCVMAIVTCFMAFATWRMASVAKKTLELQAGKPNIIVYAHLRDDAPQFIQITIENIGTAPAYDVTFKIPDNCKLTEYNAFKRGIKYLPVGKKRTFNWETYEEIVKNSPEKHIEIETFFKNSEKQPQPMVLNILTIEDFSRHTASKPRYVEQVEHLKAIANNIKDLQCTINVKLTPISPIDTYKYAYLAYLLLKDKHSDKQLADDFYHVKSLYCYEEDFGFTEEQIVQAKAEAEEIFNKYQGKTA